MYLYYELFHMTRPDQRERQLQVMHTIAGSPSSHPGAAFLAKLLDHFEIDGPNGTHTCLVLEPQDPSVPNVLDVCFVDDRLPAALARKITRQTLLGLDYLHHLGIGRGGTCHTQSSICYLKLISIDRPPFTELDI